MSTAATEELPRQYGRYLLFDKIGEGGMARIFLSRVRTDLGGERRIVVKQMLPMLSSSQRFSQLFIEEAKLSAQLSHGNVAQVFDLGREEGLLYIAMEYVEGFDLRQLLIHCSRARVGLPLEFSLFMVMQVLRALDYAHRKTTDDGRELGIVHRDVSPSNVLLSFEGEVKLCDFGIARAIGAEGGLGDDTIQGKAGYMSPEVADGKPADPRSDVFSTGVILWELLAGKRLYKVGKGQAPSLEQARQAQIPPLPERAYPQQDRLYAIAQKALARDPDSRFDSAREMLRALEDYVMESAQVVSALRFGEWLVDHFGEQIIQVRSEREHAAKQSEQPRTSEDLIAAPSAGGSPAAALTDATHTRTGSDPLEVAKLHEETASPTNQRGGSQTSGPAASVSTDERKGGGPPATAWLGIAVLALVLIVWLLR